MEHETWMDLLAEQGIWPLIMGIFLSAYELQVEASIPPEAVLLEMYVSKEPAEIMERVAEVGLFGQLGLHSRTSSTVRPRASKSSIGAASGPLCARPSKNASARGGSIGRGRRRRNPRNPSWRSYSKG